MRMLPAFCLDITGFAATPLRRDARGSRGPHASRFNCCRNGQPEKLSRCERPAKELVLSKEKPIPYQPPLPPNEALSGVDAAAGVTPVGLRPPFVTPAAAHSHPDCRGIPILIVAPHRGLWRCRPP